MLQELEEKQTRRSVYVCHVPGTDSLCFDLTFMHLTRNECVSDWAGIAGDTLGLGTSSKT